MKAGTPFCWIFGHRFIRKTTEIRGETTRVTTQPSSWCVRCGQIRNVPKVSNGKQTSKVTTHKEAGD